MTSWPDLLDAMERSLDHYEAALEADTITPDPHWPVADPPTEPIPSTLLARAADLMARNNRISAGLRARLDGQEPVRPHRPAGYARRHTGVSVLDTSA